MKLVKNLQKQNHQNHTTVSNNYLTIKPNKTTILLKLNSNQFQQILTFLSIADIHALYQFLHHNQHAKLHKLIISNYMLTMKRNIFKDQHFAYINSFCRIKNRSDINLLKFVSANKRQFKNSQLIKQDVDRTYVKGINSLSLKNFLINVLSALSKQFPKMGYIQGFNYIIKVTYLNQFTEAQSFVFASYILKKMKVQQLYLHNMVKIFQYAYVVEVYLFNYVPELYEYLKKIDISVIYFAANWFITLFSQHLPLGVINRLWNNFLLKGWKIIIKFSIAILFCYQKQILSKSKEVLSTYLKHFLQTDFNKQKQEQIFKVCKSIKISNKMITLFCNKMNHVQRDSQISIRKMRKNSIILQDKQKVILQLSKKNQREQQVGCYWKNKYGKNQRVKSESFFSLCEHPSNLRTQ